VTSVRAGDEAGGQAASTGDPRDQPIGELLKQLSQETSTLVRQELELAKAEMSQKGKKAGVGAGMLGGAGVSGLLFLGALTATIMGLLDTAMKFWLAALIVTILWAAVAGVLALQGRKKLQDAGPPVPEQAQDSVKEDVQWAKTRSRSATR
jgi:Putative Actinobacterial Holin-X, holin superfamily III